MRRILTILVALLAAEANPAAHERWVAHRLLRPFDGARLGWDEPFVLACASIVALLVVLVVTTDRRQGEPSPWRFASPALRLGLGGALLCVAAGGGFVAPDLCPDESLLGRTLLFGGAAGGALLVLGLAQRSAAILVLGLYSIALLARPFQPFDGLALGASEVLDYAYVVGAAAYLALKPSGASPGSALAARTTMRLVFGANVLALGVGKLLAPALFLGVVQNYPEVFLDPFVGLGATQERVLVVAAAVEVTAGALVLSGARLRWVCSLLLAVFGSTSLLFQGEVLGHLPILTTALVLCREGGGSVRGLLRVARRAVDTFRCFQRRTSPTPRRAPVAVAAAVAAAAGLFGLGASTQANAAVATAVLDQGARVACVRGERGRLDFIVRLDPDEPALGEFFSFAVAVDGVGDGEVVHDLELDVDVRMPEHGHGMVSAPRTERIGPGRFSIRGCAMHMHGDWQIELASSRDGGLVDRVSVPLDFQPRVAW